MFYFDGEKEKTMDKVKFCNKCQLERINNLECPYTNVVIPSFRLYLLLSNKKGCILLYHSFLCYDCVI